MRLLFTQDAIEAYKNICVKSLNNHKYSEIPYAIREKFRYIRKNPEYGKTYDHKRFHVFLPLNWRMSYEIQRDSIIVLGFSLYQ